MTANQTNRSEMPSFNMSSGDMSSGSNDGGSGSHPIGMPAFEMGSAPNPAGMQPRAMTENRPATPGELQPVLVEMRIPKNQSAIAALQAVGSMGVSGFQLDTGYEAVPMTPPQAMAALLADSDEEVVVVRGMIDASQIPALEAQANVIKVYPDSPIAPFTSTLVKESETAFVSPLAAFGTCPIGSCDCSSGTAKGTIAEVATYLGVDQIWNAGFKGEGIVVGVVDGGITAAGRPVGSEASPAKWLKPLMKAFWSCLRLATVGAPVQTAAAVLIQDPAEVFGEPMAIHW
jgi:serine protease AprX